MTKLDIRYISIYSYSTNRSLVLIFFRATTNYDLVLEIYGNESNLPGVHRVLTERGFLREPGIDALNMVGMRERTIDLSYIKLHGSIDWWYTAEGKIILNMGSENPYQVLTDRTMVYPIYEKHISQDPFFTLYQYFRWKLFHEEIVIVIGYSFRDPSINSAFSDWIHSVPSSRLIIVSRPQNHKAILDILGHSSRIQFLENYFGEPGFITNLENLLLQNGSTDLAN